MFGVKLIIWYCLICAVACCAADNAGSCATKPLYSAEGVILGQAKSPDGKKILTFERIEDDKAPDGLSVLYSVQTRYRHFQAKLPGWSTEVLWSPDSKAFAVNQTEGGGGLGQGAYLFYVSEKGLRKVDLSNSIDKAFGRPVKCEVRVPPNIAVLKWLGATRVLVVAEIVPVSICKCPGTFKTFEVLLPDLKIQRSYSQAETRRHFANVLGCELKEADDRCAKTWQH